MNASEKSGFPWLEVLLVLSVLALVFQLFPDLWFGTLFVLDFRHWTWTGWSAANAVVLLVLIFIRAWRNR